LGECWRDFELSAIYRTGFGSKELRQTGNYEASNLIAQAIRRVSRLKHTIHDQVLILYT